MTEQGSAKQELAGQELADQELIDAAQALLDLCRQKQFKLVIAESCTGGLVAATLTEIPGSSDVVDRGFVTYSNASKRAMLGVPTATLDQHGAVSRETAEAMAMGALAHAPADLAVSITGIAGPGGGTAEKPVGLVHFAAASRTGKLVHRERQFGDIGRSRVRHASVVEALALLRDLAETEAPKPPHTE
jgi:nicotinamide-nucleotide amidase